MQPQKQYLKFKPKRRGRLELIAAVGIGVALGVYVFGESAAKLKGAVIDKDGVHKPATPSSEAPRDV